MKSSKDRTEAEVRDWYARAEAGTLTPPTTPEETAEVLNRWTDITYRLPAEKIETKATPRKDATYSPQAKYHVRIIKSRLTNE